MKKAVFLLVLWAPAGWCAFTTGNDLLSDCEERATYDAGYCLGYIASANDTHDTWVHWGLMPRQYCVPKAATQGQLEQVVVKYLKERPEKLHKVASGGVIQALALAFPCK